MWRTVLGTIDSRSHLTLFASRYYPEGKEPNGTALEMLFFLAQAPGHYGSLEDTLNEVFIQAKADGKNVTDKMVPAECKVAIQHLKQMGLI